MMEAAIVVEVVVVTDRESESWRRFQNSLASSVSCHCSKEPRRALFLSGAIVCTALLNRAVTAAGGRGTVRIRHFPGCWAWKKPLQRIRDRHKGIAEGSEQIDCTNQLHRWIRWATCRWEGSRQLVVNTKGLVDLSHYNPGVKQLECSQFSRQTSINRDVLNNIQCFDECRSGRFNRTRYVGKEFRSDFSGNIVHIWGGVFAGYVARISHTAICLCVRHLSRAAERRRECLKGRVRWQ